MTVSYDQYLPTITAPTRQYYKFLGYFTGLNGSGTQYYSPSGSRLVSKCDFGADTTLYANWERLQVQVTLKPDPAGDGTGSVSPPSGKFDMGAQLVLAATPGSHSEFIAWTDASTQAVLSKAPVLDFTPTNDCTILYRFDLERFAVKFIYRTSSGSKKTTTQQVAYRLSAVPPGNDVINTWPLHSFVEWLNDGWTYVTEPMEVDSEYRWNNYQIVFDPNAAGVTGEMANQACTCAEPGSVSFGLNACTFARTGYDFLGWARSDKALEPEFEDGETITTNLSTTDGAEVRLYAVWAAKVCEVTLDPNSGSNGTTLVSVTYGAAMPTDDVVMPVRAGYTFGGFWTTPTGAGVRYYTQDGESARTWDRETNATLIARWTANQYTITLDPQGGQGGTSSCTATFDAVLPTVTKPSRTGYTFRGYWSKPKGAGVQYVDGDGKGVLAWTTPAAGTLYAKWQANPYKVAFGKGSAKGDVSGEMGQQDFTYDVPQALTPNAYARTGYSFVGWTNTVQHVFYEDGAIVSNLTSVLNGTNTLVACWTANVYRVTFDKQAGEGGTDALDVTFDAATPSVVPPTYAQQQFNGYTLGAGGERVFDGAGKPVAAHATWHMPSNVTLIADLELDWCAVSFTPNGGEGEMASQIFSKDESKALTLNAFTRTGYAFNYWETNVTKGLVEVWAKAYENGQIVSRPAGKGDTKELRAAWKPNQYTVNLKRDPATASGSESTVEMTYDVPMLMANPFTHPDTKAVFKGWSKTKGASVPDYPGTLVCNVTAVKDGNVNLYPVWEIDLGAYSKALKCTSLRFEQEGATGWLVVTNDARCTGHEVCVLNEGNGGVLYANFFGSGEGSFTFDWKARKDVTLKVITNAVAALELTGDASEAWQQAVLNLSANVTKISFETDCWPGLGEYVALDNVTWTPGGTRPEPTAADRPVVSGLEWTATGFKLKISNGDARFDYQIWTTPSLNPINWTAGARISGAAGEQSFELTPDPSRAQEFYKVEVLQKAP